MLVDDTTFLMYQSLTTTSTQSPTFKRTVSHMSLTDGPEFGGAVVSWDMPTPLAPLQRDPQANQSHSPKLIAS